MPETSQETGTRPELAWIPVDQIDVDHNYQRPIKQLLVKKILERFDWAHFGAVVLVPQESGRYHVTDGQHRVKAAVLHPAIEEVPALLIAVSGMEAEACNFLTINRDRQAVNAIEKFWAGVSSADADCLRIQRVLAEADCEIVPEQGATGPGLTNAVSAVDRSLKRYGDAAVREACRTIRSAWPKDAKALRGTLITALARLHRVNDTMDFDRLAGVLRPVGYATLTAHAEGFRKLSGGSAETALAKTITELYNKGLSKNIIYFAAA